MVSFNGKEHEILRDGVVVFENDKILFVGKDYREAVDRKMEARHCLISPGFINSHHHLGSNAGEYLLNEPDKPDFFASNYLSHLAPLKGKSVPHHLDTLEVGGLFSLIHILKCGATSVVDVGGPERDPERYVDLVGEVGIRCFGGPRHRNADLCYDKEGRLEYSWSDERGRERLKKAITFVKEFNGANNGRLSAMLFPAQVDTCTLELLQETKKVAGELGVLVQIHAAINLIEFHTVMQRYRCTPVELLHRAGLLGPEVSLSHCIFLTGHSWTVYPYGDDLKLIADSGSSVSHCPYKYLKVGVGMESFDSYLKAGINISLGTDTFPKDIISEMRYAAVASRMLERSFLAGQPRDVFNAATLGGAKLLRREDLGRLEKGAKADIIVISLRDTAFGAVHDPIKSIVETATGRDVRTVIVDGEVLVENGRYLRVDEEDLMEKLRKGSAEILKEVPSWHWTGKAVDEIQPPAFKLS